MINHLKNLWSSYKAKQELKRCTHCGKSFSRLEWGGRLHSTNNGSTYIHPIDYIMTMSCKTFEEKREAIAQMEEMDRWARRFKIDNGDRFCKDHYQGCPR
jgi:hypothetical protein